MDITVTTEPVSTALPESLTVLKAALRVEHSADDDYLKELMRAAASQVTDRTGRQILTCTRRLGLDSFWSGDLVLPYPKLQDVNSIEYIDPDGVTQTLSSGLYRVFTSGVYGRIVIDGNWPNVDPDIESPVSVYYDCGYGADSTGANVPPGLKIAIRELVRFWYEETDGNRFTVQKPFPQHVDALLDTWKLKREWVL